MHANLRRYSMPSAGIYDRVTGLLFRRRYEAIAREIAAETPAGATVLDVGCGPAEIIVRLALLSPTLRLTGVDVDAPMIDRARRKAAKAHVTPIFAIADAAALPFADASFDLVVSSFAVHHWPDPHAGLAEIMRVLKPGGRAIVWDIASPMDIVDAHAAAATTPAGPPPAPASHAAATHDGDTHDGEAHGEPTPRERRVVVVRRDGSDDASGHGWLTALRMLNQFRKMTPQRFDFAKP